jgi:hypothetical protein
MKPTKFGIAALMLVCGMAAAQQTTLRAGTLIDGKGNVLHNTTLVIEGGKIVRIDASINNATYDLCVRARDLEGPAGDEQAYREFRLHP